MSDIEYRKASTVEVRHSQRIIDLIAVPYNEQIDVMRRGKWVAESIDPDAFTGVAGGVTVNRAHDPENPLGRVLSFHPQDPRGLRTEVKISRTAAGDDVLELADDGLLSASVGFRSLAEEWNTDRTADEPLPRVSTPNLDRLRLEILAEQSGIDLTSAFT